MDFSVEVKRLTPWSLALDLARATAGKPETHKEPSPGWKRRLIRAEHSPLRAVMFLITLHHIPSWVSVHFVRHAKFAEHFVSTQRPDRTGEPVDRDELPQGAPVEHRILTNAAEILAISRKRLCNKASPETRAVWRMVVQALADDDPEIARACVPACRYLGVCPEFAPCGYERGVGVATSSAS